MIFFNERELTCYGIQKNEWHGFEMLEFAFGGKNARLVYPSVPRADKKWLFKTEYFGAFPNFELAMLERGYYVAHVQNTTRWCLPEDTDRQAVFCEFLHREFGLAKSCMPVGMSCGGMQAVYLAAKYPQLVAALYLDAPVLNLLSCPCGLGVAKVKFYDEYIKATGNTVSNLLNFRKHPIDMVDAIISEKIPTILVCGDSDRTVPYVENGMLLSKKYRASEVPFVEVLKKNCDHHPHGLDTPGKLLEFAKKYYN